MINLLPVPVAALLLITATAALPAAPLQGQRFAAPACNYKTCYDTCMSRGGTGTASSVSYRRCATYCAQTCGSSS